MKRLIPIFAAVIALAGPLALSGEAVAKDQHGGGQRSDRGSDRGGRGGERSGGGRQDGGRQDGGRQDGGRQDGGRGERGGYERRGGDDRGPDRARNAPQRNAPQRGDSRDYERRDYDRRSAERRGYEGDGPAPYAPSPRRGGYMPPQAGGAIPDYGRYRLRPPPRGFVWVRTGNGYAMVSQDTGRVFDVVPY